MKLRKFLAVLSAILLLAACLPLGAISVSAATSGKTGDCTWVLDDRGHLTISGNGKMEDYDFECKFYIFLKRFIIISKSEMVKIDADNYVVLVDTTDLGVGQLHMSLTANLPDEDFPTVTRKEIACVDTGVTVANC